MKPEVSVCIFTYNHENFIVQCIESVLMQNTNFEIEIVLGEDYSTDRTNEICKKYAKKYPNIVRLLDRGKNLGMCRNIFDSLKECKGKYTAILDGDDYWIHPLKLQMQYDFLEENTQMNLVFHQSLKLDERNGNLSFFVKNKKDKYTIGDIINKWSMATASMFFRTSALEFPEFVYHTHNFDLIIQLILNRNGENTGYIDEIMATYRINEGSNTNSPLYDFKNTQKRKTLLFEEFNEYTNYQFSEYIDEKLKKIKVLLRKQEKKSFIRFIKKNIKNILNSFGYSIKISKTHRKL